MKRVVCLLLISLSVLGASAQDTYNSSGKPGGYKKKEKKGYDPAKLVLGGGINFGYSNDFFNAGLSPKVGYNILSPLAVGVGLGYQYYRAPDFINANNQTVYLQENIITPSVWTKFTVYKSLFLAADMEYNIIKLKGSELVYPPGLPSYLTPVKRTLTAPSFLVGAGLKQPLGGRTTLTFEVLYDVIQDTNTPYPKQFVYRGGIYVGL